MHGYTTQLASSVGPDRDGMQLELISPAGQYVAEVFEDESTGERQFNGLGELTLPLAVLHWFLAEVQRRLAKRQS